MKLTIPFIDDPAYIDFVTEIKANVSCLYFALPQNHVLDARLRFKQATSNELIRALKMTPGVKKYGLLNTRFLHPDRYHDINFLKSLISDLVRYQAAGCLDGVVINDFYFLNALSDIGKKLLENIEAIPGINSLIDTPEKVDTLVDLIGNSWFKLPSRVILDRSLNRRLPELKSVYDAIKNSTPEIDVELLANEGCIYHCPFKPAHDSHIALSNLGGARDKTLITNKTLGCHSYFFNSPELFLKSPFVRPEDLKAYEGVADGIKICGRTLGTVFLKKTIAAYINRSHQGNLLELMDASFWLSDHYFIDNKKLGPDFLKIVTGCTKKCKLCRLCDNLFNAAARRIPLTIKPYKDFL